MEENIKPAVKTRGHWHRKNQHSWKLNCIEYKIRQGHILCF